METISEISITPCTRKRNTKPAECYKVAIIDKDPNTHEWRFSTEWLYPNQQNAIPTSIDRIIEIISDPLIILPLIQDIWIHRWIEDDNLKIRLIEIRKALAERITVEYYTDGSFTSNFPTSADIQDTNLIHTNMGAAFCVNNEPSLSAQTNLSLWTSSTRSELVAIFMALLTSPIDAKVKIYTDSQMKVKGHSGDKMNEIADKLAKSASSSSNYFKNRFNYSNRIVRFFPVYKNIPIEYNLRKFIKTLINTKVAAEWSQLKTNEKESPKSIAWNITWNLIHKYKGFNCISLEKHWHLIFIIKLFTKILSIGSFLIQQKTDTYKDFVCPRCNDNKKKDWYHFIKSLKAKINNNLFNLAKQLFEFTEAKDTIFIVTLLNSFIIHFKELIWLPRCIVTIAWEKTNNIGKKDKLNKTENMEHYFKSSYQQTKCSRQEKQQLESKKLSEEQEILTTILVNSSYKIATEKNCITSKRDIIIKKIHDQMCLLINNNGWFSWAYKKTSNIINNVILDLESISVQTQFVNG
ncbi:ribonuclease H-like domain-containing protein [Rhizophagus clarus]|uniref:Ribonuclease H-like domain-containing protein n=1 Tax=Rhizophagus clarus TaxID=94130 RepID=A0A8H3L049_9GLOM|nr:ribonuclease H-like domain-containing protein [Rhizophagus clarus]